jgi:small subunit ribosomal protein S20
MRTAGCATSKVKKFPVASTHYLSQIMANHKSAIKKMRQDEVRRRRNASYKTRMKNLVKKVEMAIAEKDIEGAKAALQKAIPILDKLAAKGIIHLNKASRKKSRLMHKLNALIASQTSA